MCDLLTELMTLKYQGQIDNWPIGFVAIEFIQDDLTELSYFVIQNCGEVKTNNKGKLIESFINTNYLCKINTFGNTYLHLFILSINTFTQKVVMEQFL